MLLRTERYAPIFGAAIAAGFAWFYIPRWSSALAASGEDFSNVFGPVFDLATFSAGALFAIYVLALSKADGFLGKIFNTVTFRLFHRYVANAIAVSVILSLWTAGYMIVGMGNQLQGVSLALASGWFGLTIWMLLSVSRVVLIFLIMVGCQGGDQPGKRLGQTS